MNKDSYHKEDVSKEKKPLPIGISDYIRAQAEYYYVDKTLLIKEFLDQKSLVSLFTRPRRFGKTLNMDMLRVFFEKSTEDTSIYFTDKIIWKCGEKYTKHQGKYPVIFLTFKDVKFDSWEATIDKIRVLLQAEFGRHRELMNSENIAEYEKQYFFKIMNGTATEVELTSALEILSRMLAEHHGKAPIIIIDEYDTPIQEGYSRNFYKKIILFDMNDFCILTRSQLCLIFLPEIFCLTVKGYTAFFFYQAFLSFMAAIQKHRCFNFSCFFQYLINFLVHSLSCLNPLFLFFIVIFSKIYYN